MNALRPFLAASLLALPAACGAPGGGPLDIVAIAGDAAADADPARTAASRAGLVGFDAEGRIAPALAERWVVTADGLAYIFRLRDGQWNDGSPITAADVAAALRRALGAARAKPLGASLATIRAVKVMARRVIEIDLAAPQPDLLALLAHPDLGLAAGPHDRRRAAIMEVRDEGGHALATLIPPDRPGLPLVPFPRGARRLMLSVGNAADAVARFADGKADLVTGGTLVSLPLAPRGGLLRGNLQLDPVTGLFGLDVVAADGFLADPARREALAMAIDRDALAAAFAVSGWQTTTRIVAPGLDGDSGLVGERWTGVTLDQRRAVAQAQVRGWLASGGSATLTLALPAGPGADMLFAQLRGDWAAIGLDLRRAAPGQAADLVLLDRVAAYPKARWFLETLSCAAHRAVCSAPGDAALAEATHAADPAEAARLLAQAEAAITAANGFVPLARPLRWSLVRGDLAGFAPNPWGWHALPPLAAGDDGGR